MVSGVNHATFSVEDLPVSFEFYVEILGCRPVARWAEGAYLLAGEFWITLILDKAVRRDSTGEYTHVAFCVSESDFGTVSRRITGYGADIWQENRTPGMSLYFTDPDGHKLEISTSSLGARIEADKLNPPEGMEFYV